MKGDSFSRRLLDISERFSLWDLQFREYWDIETATEDDPKEAVRRTLDIHAILSEILHVFIEWGRFKDNWEFPPGFLPVMPFGVEAVLRSNKLNVNFLFGVETEGFFLEAPLVCPWNLPAMKDDFWIEFSSLHSLGDFSLFENSPAIRKEHKRMRKAFLSPKSTIFKLVRNVLLFELDGDDMVDLGDLEIKWPGDLPWDDLIRNGAEAFKKLYAINYRLYRAEYVAKHGSTTRRGRC